MTDETQIKPPAKIFNIHQRTPHAEQRKFIDSRAKRKVIRAGRRSGKTVGISYFAVDQFINNRRILYATPTQEQIDRFWIEICRSLSEPIEAGLIYKNETRHILEIPGTETRIRAKTAWNADSLRGDYADLLILDEYQLMNEDAWGLVGAPMLLDNNGDAVFIYTPPSLHSRSSSKARDPQHAAKLYKRAQQDTAGRWQCFTFTSFQNPHLSQEALAEITQDMTALAFRMEIQAEDVDTAPGALWNRDIIENNRVIRAPEYDQIVVGVDPSTTSTGDEAGIITAGKVKGSAVNPSDRKAKPHFYTIADDSIQGSPREWATRAVEAYHRHKANRIVAEVNNGGEMVKMVIQQIDSSVVVEMVTATRGKQTRAEPISAIFEEGRGHHAGKFDALEDEMCLWIPGDPSPNRLDAMVWAYTKLNGIAPTFEDVADLGHVDDYVNKWR